MSIFRDNVGRCLIHHPGIVDGQNARMAQLFEQPGFLKELIQLVLYMAMIRVQDFDRGVAAQGLMLGHVDATKSPTHNDLLDLVVIYPSPDVFMVSFHNPYLLKYVNKRHPDVTIIVVFSSRKLSFQTSY